MTQDASTHESAEAAWHQDDELLRASAKVPQHVVYRNFPTETVVLNLQTGKYHGLNATAGEMLKEIERSPSLADAARALAKLYEQPGEVLERDVCGSVARCWAAG